MENSPNPDQAKAGQAGTPPSGQPQGSNDQPVDLQPRGDTDNPNPSDPNAPKKPAPQIHLAKRTYRPSHKATFIAVAVILGLILVNAGVVAFILNREAQIKANGGVASVTPSNSLLDQLGVNHTNVGSSQESLLFSPNAVFQGTLTVNKAVSLAGNLVAGPTSLVQLNAGSTSLSQLNVSGASTQADAVFKGNVLVNGTTQFQNTVTVNTLMNADSLNVVGNITVGGTLTTNGFSARSLTSNSTLTIGGHVVTLGSSPSIGQGPAVGPAGTVNMSGNDASGTIAVNTGQAPTSGILANIAFRTPYGATPHVIISPIGPDPSGMAGVPLGFYVNRSSSGFSIGTINTPATGTGYVFDYIVEQ